MKYAEESKNEDTNPICDHLPTWSRQEHHLPTPSGPGGGLVKFAYDREIWWIRLDGAGPKIDELPQFDW
jgi:hypothetical protein